jgi:hypothetical protein
LHLCKITLRSPVEPKQDQKTQPTKPNYEAKPTMEPETAKVEDDWTKARQDQENPNIKFGR